VHDRDLGREAVIDPLVGVVEPGLGVDRRGDRVVQGDHQLLTEGGEVAADGAGPAAVGVDLNGLLPGR
jgi:hypothetical protein